ncbi:MAG: hypothetical protein EOP56_04810 [Sphingobacteriales bacterium]|nr:MAG: hypothetical protein EOP56_04810 [Sphingobacteriales bacterium]
MRKSLFDDTEMHFARINKMIIEMLNRTNSTRIDSQYLSVYQMLDEVMGDDKDRFYLKHIEQVRGNEDECCITRNHAFIISTLANIVIKACRSMNAAGSLLKLTAQFSNNLHMVKVEDEVCANNAQSLEKVYSAFVTNNHSKCRSYLPVTLNIFKTSSAGRLFETAAPTGACFILSF